MKISNSKYPLTLQNAKKVDKPPNSVSFLRIKSKELFTSKIVSSHFYKPISKIINFENAKKIL